jgi:hypothetical protein
MRRAIEIAGDVVFVVSWVAVVLSLPLWFLLPTETWYWMMFIIIPIWIAALIGGYTGPGGTDPDSLAGGGDGGSDGGG